MPKQPVTEALNLILTNQNVELQRQVTDLRRDLDSARKENEMLWAAMERPAIATMTEQQVHALAELFHQHVLSIPIRKEEKPA